MGVASQKGLTPERGRATQSVPWGTNCRLVNETVTFQPLRYIGKEATVFFLTRSPSQSIYLSLANSVDPTTPIGELFKDGPLRVRIMAIRGSQVRIGVQVPQSLEVHREERPEGVPHPTAA